MGIVNFSLLGAGAALIVVAVLRGRGPWTRLQALKDQDANVARYEAWRGGLRDEGTTGASVAMAILRAQVRSAAIVGGIGVILVIAGFAWPA